MARPLTPANKSAEDHRNDRLHTLVARIAAGDRAAFRTVYAFLVTPVWCEAIRLLPPADARAVTRSTFVELWHLAGHHLNGEGHETRAWVQSITARHIQDRPCSNSGGRLQRDYDHHTHRVLVTLLGAGQRTDLPAHEPAGPLGHDRTRQLYGG